MAPAKASITAGYAPSVLNMPPIALQPVLKLPSALPYASFISPTTFVASNYYMSAANGPIAAGVLWDGDTVVATVGEGVTLNLTQAFEDTGGNYQQSLHYGHIYYAILMPNYTAPVLANFNPPVPDQPTVAVGSACLSVSDVQSWVFYMNQFTSPFVGCVYSIDNQLPETAPEVLSEGRVTFVSPLVLAPVSNYWLLALENPVAFYYSYINISELLSAPNFAGQSGLVATDVPQLSSLFTLLRWGSEFNVYLPIGVWIVGFPFIIDMNPSVVVHKTSSGSWASTYSGVAFYPVEVSTPLVTQYFMTTGFNVSVNPGIGTVTLPYAFYKYAYAVPSFIAAGGTVFLSAANGTTTISGSLVNGPTRPTLVVIPLGFMGTGEAFPWFQAAYFSPSDINETAEFYPLAVVPEGYDSYLILAGGIGVTHLYILKVNVVPGALNPTYSVSSVNLSLVNEINFAGYGNPTSAVVNGYLALVGTETGNVVLVNLLNGKF
jgi:hypothetical protein